MTEYKTLSDEAQAAMRGEPAPDLSLEKECQLSMEEIAKLREEKERLLALLKHADAVVIWEHTPARSGFQEEIEAALGIVD